MLTIIVLMISGIILGRILRRFISQYVPRVITVLIWVLLFILGAEAGGNDEITSRIESLGFEALVITIGAMAGSIAASWLLWRWIRRDGKEDGE